jgi:hypothetical protein
VSGDIVPHIIDLGTISRGVVSFTPRQLNQQGKNPWYPFDKSLIGLQSRSERSNIKMDLKQIGCKVCAGFMWLRIETSGGLL